MRRGISVIELLVVIGIIVIFSGIIVFSIVDMSVSSKANRIYNNLVQIKMATLLWRTNNPDKILADGKVKTKAYPNGEVLELVNTKDALGILKYIEGGEVRTLNENGRNRINDGTYGTFSESSRTSVWHVGYRFNNYEGAVKAKMKEKASSYEGMVRFSKNWPPNKYTTDNEGDDVIWLQIAGERDEK